MGDERSTIEEARQRLFSTSPEDASATLKAGAAAIRAGLEHDALPLLQAAVARHPQDARLGQLLGLIHRNMGDLSPSLDILRRAARQAPKDALIAHTLARATLEAGLPAAELFESAHALNPLDASTLLGRAAAYVASGDTARPIAQLDDVLVRNPGWAEGHVALARLRWMGGAGQAATDSFERALAGRPDLGIVWREFVQTLLSAERYEDALDAVSRARAAVGASGTLDLLEAAILSESGALAKADACFASLQPVEGVTATVRYARHLLRAGRPDEAARLLEDRVGQDSSSLPLWPYLATAWRLTNDSRWRWLEGDPRLVAVYDIGERVGSLSALASRLQALHRATHQPLEQTVRGGTQTDGPLFSRLDPEIASLRGAVLTAVDDYVRQLPPPDPRHPFLRQTTRTPLRFAGSWSVRLTDAGRHVSHVHPAGWISSAFYVSLPETMGGDEQAGWLTFGAQPELGLDLPPFRTVEPKAGRLVLFPSLTWHGTLPFSVGERLTVAFDIARPTG